MKTRYQLMSEMQGQIPEKLLIDIDIPRQHSIATLVYTYTIYLIVCLLFQIISHNKVWVQHLLANPGLNLFIRYFSQGISLHQVWV